MVTVAEVCDLIRNQLRGTLPADAQLDENTELERIGLTSMQVTDIVFSLEDGHGFEFDAGRAADVRTIGELVVLANNSLSGDAEPETEEAG